MKMANKAEAESACMAYRERGSQRLKAERERRGLTIAQVARRAGETRDTVARAEEGIGLTMNRFYKLLDAIGVDDPSAVLVSLEIGSSEISSAACELLLTNMYRKMSEKIIAAGIDQNAVRPEWSEKLAAFNVEMMAQELERQRRHRDQAFDRGAG